MKYRILESCKIYPRILLYIWTVLNEKIKKIRNDYVVGTKSETRNSGNNLKNMCGAFESLLLLIHAWYNVRYNKTVNKLVETFKKCNQTQREIVTFYDTELYTDFSRSYKLIIFHCYSELFRTYQQFEVGISDRLKNLLQHLYCCYELRLFLLLFEYCMP